ARGRRFGHARAGRRRWGALAFMCGAAPRPEGITNAVMAAIGSPCGSSNRRYPCRSDPMSEAFAFGPFRLLVARRELLAHGVPVTLGQRAFEVLLMLVSRQGQLVTKDELMAEVWPGVVVEENNIQVHISAVRKVLAAAGDGDRYLLTVAGRGYRFVAPVTRETAGEVKAAAVADQSAPVAADIPAATNNLPQQLTSLIGREADLAEIKT